MTFTADQQPTKRRGRSRIVTRHEVAAAWERIRDAAAAGDIQASAALIALTGTHPLHPEPTAA